VKSTGSAFLASQQRTKRCDDLSGTYQYLMELEGEKDHCHKKTVHKNRQLLKK
jgi:hypothetical protein